MVWSLLAGGTTIFWFPHTVNEVDARFTALIVVFVSLFGIAFYDSYAMHWIITFQTLDFILRVLGGGKASLAGSLAGWFSVFFEERLTSGPPKQFAALCGVIFSGLATLFLWLGQGLSSNDSNEHGNPFPYYFIGQFILFFLCIAASLEGFLNFCIGCKCYGLIQMALPKSASTALFEISQADLEDKINEVTLRGNAMDWLPSSVARYKSGSRKRELLVLPSPLDWCMGESVEFGCRSLRDYWGHMYKGVDMDDMDPLVPMSNEAQHISDESSSSSSSDSEDSEKGRKMKEVKKKRKKGEQKVGELKPDTPSRRSFFGLYCPDGPDKNFTYIPPHIEGLPKTSKAGKFTYKYRKDGEPLLNVRDWNFVRYMVPSIFAIPVGVGGLALVYKVNDEFNILDLDNYDEVVWKILGVTAGIIHFILLSLYLMKFFLYPSKIYKELFHPHTGNAMPLAFIVLLILAFLAESESHTLAKILFWTAAPISLFFGFMQVVIWIHKPWTFSSITPIMLIPPLTNLVVAMVGPAIDTNYTEAMWLWWSFGILFFVPIFVISLHGIFVVPGLPHALAPSVFLYMAALFVTSISYVILAAATWVVNPWFNSVIPRLFYFAGLSLFFVNVGLAGIYFFFFEGFSQTYWGISFSLSTLSINTLLYHQEIDGDLTHAMSVLSIVLTSWVAFHYALLTVEALLRRKIFARHQASGPLALTKLTHYAFKGAIKELCAMGSDLDEDTGKEFIKKLTTLLLAHREHARYEDTVLFPLLEEYFPGVTNHCGDEHREQHQLIDQLTGLCEEGKANELLEGWLQLAKMIVQHMDSEEYHLSKVIRQHIPAPRQRTAVRQMWRLTSVNDWRVILPWMMTSLDMQSRRVGLLQSLVRSLPERAQLIGQIVHEGVPRQLWHRLTEQIPELRPKNTGLHTKFY